MTTTAMQELLAIMARLRDPEQGCPWDRRQDFASIVPHTLEEAYELAEAIEHNSGEAIRDELGDLLFQVVFYAQLGREAGWFDFEAVAAGICEKLRRRHPHVFGDVDVADEAKVHAQWEQIKAGERAGEGKAGTLAGVAANLPALTRARKLQKRAAGVGFDWADTAPVIDKIREELDEFGEELALSDNRDRLEEELGDFLFAGVNLARHAGIDPERALRRANRKFETRFAYIEARMAERGSTPADASLEEMDALWEEAKANGD